MKAKKINDIEMIELPTEWSIGPVNLFLIKGEKLTLVDAGRRLRRAWDTFNATLNQRGFSIMDIEQVVLTHHHTDHTGLLDWLLEKNPIPVYAHRNCLPYLKQDKEYFKSTSEFFENFFQQHGVPTELIEELIKLSGEEQELRTEVDITTIEEGSIIPGLSEWKVIETIGHAQSHLSLYRPRDQVLLCGDHLIKHMPSGIFLEAPIFPETIRAQPLIQYINSLKKCLSFPVSLALSGHGEPIEDVQNQIHETLNKIERRTHKVKNMLHDGKKNAFQIIQCLYPIKYKRELWLFLSDIVSLLDLLTVRNEVQLEEVSGVTYYSI